MVGEIDYLTYLSHLPEQPELHPPGADGHHDARQDQQTDQGQVVDLGGGQIRRVTVAITARTRIEEAIANRRHATVVDERRTVAEADQYYTPTGGASTPVDPNMQGQSTSEETRAPHARILPRPRPACAVALRRLPAPATSGRRARPP